MNYEIKFASGKMKILVSAFCLTLCFFKTCQLSSLKPKAGLCILTVIIVRASALPAYFYEAMDEFEDIHAKYDIFKTTMTYDFFKPTTATTEAPIPDEWQIRGDFRVKCVDEVGVGPKKVVRIMTLGKWDDNDLELKKWALCVMNKLDLMSKEGVFKMDVAMSKIYNKDKEEAESLINHCLPNNSMEPHEIAWQYVKCHSITNGNLSAISVF